MREAWVNVCYRLLRGICQAVGSLPRAFMYGPLRMAVYFFAYKVFGYRTGVVGANLRNSFPEKSAAQLLAIEKEFYRHLAELFVDMIVLSSISPRQLRRRVTIADLEEHEARIAGRDWIAAMSHYGSWEYFTVYQLYTTSQVVGVYHTLRSEVFDRFFRWLRSRTGMRPVSSRMLLRHIVKNRSEGAGRNMAIGMIADQTTPFTPRYRLMMLGQPTDFSEGIETMALRFGMPVYFLRLRKTGVARYEGSFEQLWDGREKVAEYTIMARYAAKLEEQIRACPPYWLWSHRRWKERPWRDVPIEKPEKWL